MSEKYDLVVIGGGAAGFFTAINAAEMNPAMNIAILERGKEVLTKVKVSGGGRCNVTHAEFIPEELVENYPRGQKELLGPFHKFMTGDTVGWFEERGVPLKTEDDGRMFPTTDSSETIINCFLDEADRLGVEIRRQQAVRVIEKVDEHWKVKTQDNFYLADRLMVATGSNTKIWKLLESLGHQIVTAVPSLFTFNITDERIQGLAGIAVNAEVVVLGKDGKTLLSSDGPLLITHWGMSGPAILKLSAWGARLLEPLNYNFDIEVNWVDGMESNSVEAELRDIKSSFGRKLVAASGHFGLPKRLWQKLVSGSRISEETIWADLKKDELIQLTKQLTRSRFTVEGKSTFKEEFVTAGGVSLKEVNFKNFESKIHPGLYFAGEVLDIDAITGGFNFQNAWTGAYLAAKAIAKTD